jgi:diguanylate cyclase (GGDEF)-like protein/hemerythrin-like metal-binding protein
MDLNRFKPVNDIYGHEAGDFVLKTVAERWQAVVRECDMLARLGGDEFALIITGLSSPEDADVIAQKLIEVLQQPITLPTGGLCEVGTSIGIAIYPNNAMEMDSLIAAADDAMYKNKSSGHNKATFTEQTIDFTPNKQWLTLNAADLTGIDKMDNQHRTLVGMINEINRGLYRDVKDIDLENHLKELVTYTTAHFEMEHGLMLKYAYPDIEAHDKQHQHLEEEIKKISQLAEDGDELRLLQTMKDWLTGHIQQSDKPLGVYLIAKGVQE